MPKILLVEDDKDLAGVLREWLTSEHYSLDVSGDGADGYEFLQQGDYDLIILDWDLPGMPGIEILRRYRKSGGLTPVLMLTGKGQTQDKEQGLDSGADDYLTKPFSMRELSARLRALLRRPPAFTSQTLKIYDLELDPVKHVVSKDGVEMRLLRKDFELLEFFMRHPGSFYSIEFLLERIWSFDSEASNDAVRSSVKRLRKFIDKSDDESASLIENVRKLGYRLRDDT